MVEVKPGQCGMCTHFGEGHDQPAVVEIRQSGQAPDDLVEDCELPRHASLHLKVTPISGCDGFEPAAK